MQDAVRRRAQNQRNTVSAVAAYHDQVRVNLLCNCIDFGFRTSENQMLVFLGDAKRVCKFAEVGFCSLLDLLLDRRQVHRNVASVSKAERLNGVHTAELRSVCLRHRAGPLRYVPRLIGKIQSNQDVGIFGHVCQNLWLPWPRYYHRQPALVTVADTCAADF